MRKCLWQSHSRAWVRGRADEKVWALGRVAACDEQMCKSRGRWGKGIGFRVQP